MKKSHLIINEETGEILLHEEINEKSKSKDIKNLTKKVVDEMLTKASDIGEFDSDLLYKWCRIIGNINEFGQIKLLGAYNDQKFQDDMLDEGVMYIYFLKALKMANKYSNFIKLNNKSFVTSWVELYDALDIKNSKTRAKFKKMAIDNNFITLCTIFNENGISLKRMIVNPFLLRKTPYSSIISITSFQNFISEGKNIDSYSVRWLESIGHIDIR